MVERYRTHPVPVRFAETEFRPIAPDRITTGYLVMPEIEEGDHDWCGTL